jgi:hypothetical protein
MRILFLPRVRELTLDEQTWESRGGRGLGARGIDRFGPAVKGYDPPRPPKRGVTLVMVVRSPTVDN